MFTVTVDGELVTTATILATTLMIALVRTGGEKHKRAGEKIGLEMLRITWSLITIRLSIIPWRGWCLSCRSRCHLALQTRTEAQKASEGAAMCLEPLFFS